MDLVAQANAIYMAICDDPQARAKIKAEYKSLAISIATDPNASAQITSSTVNGQTFSARQSMTNSERLSLLRLVVSCIDRGAIIPRVLISTFG
jgi:hypothetical protein